MAVISIFARIGGIVLTPHYQDENVTVYAGDCLEVLEQLPECSVDSVCTDPPYGLEFMGKEWDAPWRTGNGFRRSQNPSDTGRDNVFGRQSKRGPEYFAGAEFQQWCTAWVSECLRVLKPGGHLIAFGGTRTWHRLACAIEDSGFEIRDSIAWLYGCLTADTEVLTDAGWKLGIDVTEGDLVAQWDSETDQITLAPVQQVFRAPWDGPMRILRNADTDQVLTPNHRVYHRPAQRKMVSGKRRRWFDNQWQVAEAADLSTWNPVQLPVAGHHEGSGIGGDDYAALLGWVWTEGGFDPSGTGVRIYQSSVNADKVAEIAALMDRIGAHKRYDRERTYRGRVYTETMWLISGELAERVRADLPGKRPTYDLLWRMTGSEKLALLRAAMLGDGSGWGTRSQQFHQKYEDDLVWLQTLLTLVGRSGKVAMRPDRQCGALYLRDRATTELQARHLRDHTEHYTGEVWCVKVPSGAFVARREGKVFITGNSGFPKSLDVSKAIDKRRDDEEDIRRVCRWLRARIDDHPTETIRTIAERFGFHARMVEHWAARDTDSQPTLPTLTQWDQLRDLLEFDDELDAEVYRLNLRKGEPGEAWADRPIVGTVTEWADRTNYALTSRDGLRRGESTNPVALQWQGWGTALKPAFEPIVVARKPLQGTVAANVLAHGTGALNIDACRIATDEDRSRPPRAANAIYGGGKGTNSTASESNPTGRWPTNVVLDGEMAAQLDEQSGITTSSGGKGEKSGKLAANVYGDYAGTTKGANAGGLGDTGGASRFFPVFRYEAKADSAERPKYQPTVLRLRSGLTQEEVDRVTARLREVGVEIG